MEVDWVQSIYHSDGLNNTLLFQGYVLENGSHGGNDGQNVCSKDRGVGKEPSIAQVQLRSTGNHILLMISSNGKLNQKLRYKKRKGPNKDRVEVNKIHRNLQRDKKTNSWINKIHKPLARLISKKKRHKLPILAMQ